MVSGGCGDSDGCGTGPSAAGKAGFAAAVAQLVERVLGKDEVTGPSPVSSSLVNTLFRFSV